MKDRILSNWNFRRILYLAIGTLVIAQSFMQQQWLGVLIGSYFSSMGLFAFGCAAGNCFEGNCVTNPSGTEKSESLEN